MTNQFHVVIEYNNIINMPYYFDTSSDTVKNIGRTRVSYPENASHIDYEVFRTSLEREEFIQELRNLCARRAQDFIKPVRVTFDEEGVEEYYVHDEDITTYAEMALEEMFDN